VQERLLLERVCCRINAAFREASERRIYAAAYGKILRREPNGTAGPFLTFDYLSRL